MAAERCIGWANPKPALATKVGNMASLITLVAMLFSYSE